MSRTETMRFERGTLLARRYELGHPLGTGGMAEVYQATDRRLGRAVAVKVIRPELAADERAVARFRREARAAGGLSHPGIVAVHDVGIHGGSPFMVMELVRGRTLARVLLEEGRMTPDRAVSVGRDVADALSAAHAAGVIHRDVKPGNVMVTAEGTVKVLDFGIARVAQWTPLTETRTMHGTAEYMSPEQIRGDPVDERSDVYSLGVVLFELVAGRPPFGGDSPLAIAFRHMEEPPPALRAVRPDAPAALEAILERCLAKEPGHRYRSAADLRTDLDRVRAGESPATLPVPEGTRTRVMRSLPEEPPPRRRGRLGWVLAGIAAVGIAGAAAIGFLGDGTEPATRRLPRLRPPDTVTAEAGCSGIFSANVTLRWDPSLQRRVEGYEVYRAADAGGPYHQIALVPDRATSSYFDEDVRIGNQYAYVIRATGSGLTSPASDEVRVETPPLCVFG
jgi:eukaryotic-like serine/threonine-protein kinase